MAKFFLPIALRICFAILGTLGSLGIRVATCAYCTCSLVEDK